MISSLVVVFSCVELLILPFRAQAFLWTDPMVAGDWMGLAVKTDGAVVASGAITEGLIHARAFAATGVRYTDGWIVGTTSPVKVFIDLFSGVWAIDRGPGERVRLGSIWERFPKVVLGYVISFLAMLRSARRRPRCSPGRKPP